LLDCGVASARLSLRCSRQSVIRSHRGFGVKVMLLVGARAPAAHRRSAAYRLSSRVPVCRMTAVGSSAFRLRLSRSQLLEGGLSSGRTSSSSPLRASSFDVHASPTTSHPDRRAD
jgi:hypothetical protein